MTLKQILRAFTLCAFTCNFEEIVGKGLMLHLCVFLDLMHLVSLSRFMLLNATLWLAVTHTLKGNGPNLANWSK